MHRQSPCLAQAIQLVDASLGTLVCNAELQTSGGDNIKNLPRAPASLGVEPPGKTANLKVKFMDSGSMPLVSYREMTKLCR